MSPNGTRKGKLEAAAARRRAAMEYRKAGMPYRGIGEKLGVSGVQAFKDVRAALADIKAATNESAEELILLEQERLDGARMAIAARVLAIGELGAIDRWIRISESYRALLGLDAPKKTALTTPDGSAAWQPFDPKRLKNLSPEQLEILEELLAVMNSGGTSVSTSLSKDGEDES